MTDPDAVEYIEFVRGCLAAEVRDRAPELPALAARIEALPLDDPRLTAWWDSHHN